MDKNYYEDIFQAMASEEQKAGGGCSFIRTGSCDLPCDIPIQISIQDGTLEWDGTGGWSGTIDGTAVTLEVVDGTSAVLTIDGTICNSTFFSCNGVDDYDMQFSTCNAQINPDLLVDATDATATP